MVNTADTDSASSNRHDDSRRDSPDSDHDQEKGSANRIVRWKEEDPGHPRNWSQASKWSQVVMLTLLTFMVQYAGSAYEAAQEDITIHFHTSKELTIVGVSVLLLSYAIVPIFLAPLSEAVGRVPVYLCGYFGFLILTIPTAVTTDISIMIVFRFLSGCFGCVGNTMIGGSITDLFGPEDLGPPMSFYIIFGLLLSLPMGPLINGFVVQNSRLGYHWVFWFQVIFGAPVFVLLLVGLRETRPAILLKKRARAMTKESGKHWQAEGDDQKFSETMMTTLKHPWLLMFTDYTIAVFSLWLAFAWGLTYGMLQSISTVFTNHHDFTVAQVGLIYISPIVALVLALVASGLQESYFRKKYRKNGHIVPEARIQIACVGSFCMTLGLFYYGWTSGRGINPIIPIVSIGIVFFGIFTVYYAVFLYICDNYSDLASSALSAAGFWRNMLAAAFPLFVTQMYDNLGYQWASSTLAFISIPIGLAPFAIIWFGPKIRAHSKYIET